MSCSFSEKFDCIVVVSFNVTSEETQMKIPLLKHEIIGK